MLIATDFSFLVKEPCSLTLGNFDGVHLGHEYLLGYMRKLKEEKKQKIVLITFINHPLEILQPVRAPKMICSLEQKITLLKAQGIDILYLLQFTEELSSLPYDIFLQDLRKICNFKDLVLGEGASFGKNREGTEENVKNLSASLGFQCHYLAKMKEKDLRISSGAVRKKIQEGSLEEVSELLGRPYSIHTFLEHEKEEDFLIPQDVLQNLELPPEKEYKVLVRVSEQEFTAKASIKKNPLEARLSCPFLPKQDCIENCEILF